MTNADISHKVIALISGGKDSFLSILQCQAQGHQIIALANLCPQATRDAEAGDLNSHMYQTAGHSLITYYKQALGLPLYRREIQYETTQFRREYDPTRLGPEGKDETEDLTELLKLVMSEHPDASAVCSGAVLSTYQRTRIESVSLRLGLRPLAYLWQMSFLPGYSETGSISSNSCTFLDYIAEVGLDARIVKVASGGLDESFLWQSLLNPKTRQKIRSAMRKFGGSVIGEGGEYETIVISGPKTLFKGEIVVSSSAMTSRIGQGGEAWLDVAVDSGVYVKLNDEQEPISASSGPIETQAKQGEDSYEIFDNMDWRASCHTTKGENLLWINNLSHHSPGSTCAEQMRDIVNQIQSHLVSEGLTAEHLTLTTIVLRRMEDFETINAIYGTLFQSPVPAARITIGAGKLLPSDVDILVSCIVYRGDLKHKEGLHVQSISHWAPANIGPYSQAISVRLVWDGEHSTRLVYIAGQIPLIPETMQPLELPKMTPRAAFRAQAKLALRHATRIGIEMGASCWNSAVAYVRADAQISAFERATIAFDIWRETHAAPIDTAPNESNDEDGDGPDAWDLRYGGQGSHASIEEADRSLPALSFRGGELPAFLAVQVDSLPRGQSIEWQTTAVIPGSRDISFYQNVNGNFRYKTPKMNADGSLMLGAALIPCYEVWRAEKEGLVEMSNSTI